MMRDFTRTMMRQWVERLRAPATRRMYRYYVLRFLKFHNTTPEESVKWSIDEAEDRLEEWKYSLINAGLSGATVQNAFGAVRRWFKDHRIRIQITCRDVDATKTYLDYIPSREDVQKLLDGAKLHHRVCIALMAFSGLRPVDVANLTLANIKQSLDAGDEVLTIVLRQQKTRDWYFTFLSPQGTRYVRSLLWQRERWEQFNDDTKVVAWEDEPLSAYGIRAALRRIIKRTVGEHPTNEPFRRFRPYSLRKYFRRTISSLGAEVAEFLMGHRAGVNSLVATYSGLKDMDAAAIAALKKQYISLLPELETEVSDTTLKAQLDKQEKERVALAEKMDEIQKEQAELKEFLAEMRKRKE